MKLKDGFILHHAGGEYMAVASGAAAEAFNGMVRNNKTAAFIFEQLMEDTTEEAIINKMCEKYDAPREQIAADVKRMMEQLRKAGFLDE